MNDLRFAIRQLLKNPGFSAVVVITLALGIGANTALFSVINAVLLRPLPYEGQDRLMTLWERNPVQGVDQQTVSPPNYADWDQRNHSFESLAFWTGPFDYNWVSNEGLMKVRASYGSSSLFGLLRVEPQLGRGFLSNEDRPQGPQSALISYKLWHERFGEDPQVIGRSLTVDTYGRRTYTILGVMPQGFQFPADTDLWLAAGWNGLPRDRRGGHWLNVLGRLKTNVTPAMARAELNGIQRQLTRENPGVRMGSEVLVVPLLHHTVGRNLHRGLLVLWGVVVGVLLIACTNVANLMLARAATRQREIALRLALGAGRARVIRQLLTESLLLAIIGGALGALFGYFGVKLFLATSPTGIPRVSEISVDGSALGFTMIAAVFTGVAFGLAPVLQFSRPNLNETLKEGTQSVSGGISVGRLRNGLVAAEVALATILLMGAGLMLQSLAKLLTTDRGFQVEHITTVELDFSVAGFTTWVRPTETRPQVRLRELMERLSQLPGVDSVGAAYRSFRRDNQPPVQSFVILGNQGLPEVERPLTEVNAVSPGYIRALGLRLLRGRDLMESDTLDAPGAVLVNESFARRFFPRDDAVGKYVTIDRAPGPLGSTNVYGSPTWSQIVGVVSDVKSLSTQPQAAPEILWSYWQWPMQSPTLFMRASGDPFVLAATVRREVKAVIPNLPDPKILRLVDRVDESMAQPRFQAVLLSLFGGLALILAICGIYGVLTYSVAQRQREIAVRMALGARKANVLSLVVGHGLRITLTGLAIGIIAALGLTRIIRTLLYDVRPTDVRTFVTVSLILISAALFACWLPARRATQVEPMAALRHE